jgi:hypothetical protein
MGIESLKRWQNLRVWSLIYPITIFKNHTVRIERTSLSLSWVVQASLGPPHRFYFPRRLLMILKDGTWCRDRTYDNLRVREELYR